MNAQTILNTFEFSCRAIKVNLEDISPAESLQPPSPGGNHINWVMGHILISRDVLLSMLGQKPVLTDKSAKPYKRGSMPSPETEYIPLTELLTAFDETQIRLKAGLEALTPEQLTKVDPDSNNAWERQPLIDQLMFLLFHEAYHVGQLGLLRRLLGKDGAIA